MPAKKIGDARQSQLVSTYGVGSLYPAEDQSYMVMGTEYWPPFAPRLDEPRLARALGVKHFKSPAAGGSADVPVTPFPLTHYCPRCHVLGAVYTIGDDKSWCARCNRSRLVPSRFVACCDAGHIEDFPYFGWVHGGEDRSVAESEHQLTLRIKGESSSLSDIVIGCSCGAAPKSLNGAFGPNALATVRSCKGRRPWLETDDESCDRPLRALQRGSSNVWFASMRSTISIPPWSTAAAAWVERHWTTLEHVPDDILASVLAPMVATSPGVSVEAVRAVIADRRGLATGHQPSEDELRRDEFSALRLGTMGASAHDTFICEPETVAEGIAAVVAQVSTVHRLREVRAIEGFSRVTPHVPDGKVKKAPLSQAALDWLPALEVHGEGIFVRLDEALLTSWEGRNSVRVRVRTLNEAKDRRDREYERPESAPVLARTVALHTMSHLLLNELSLHAGYPASALRERLYDAPDQAGILVYTASSDSAGSLGGLAALAKEDVFAPIWTAAVERGRWCSSDPVCAESFGSGTDNLNLAACHACLLLPETSCENRNAFLDRVCVVGSDDVPDAALFPA
ncbi:DUF1998 domain-containing protein [Cellulomonas marina]|uniref:MrfA-like Zn-binding domain-containing protein n=1 Tax=Cellulomonas marina TaxID=988821 RepID=A0A1I0Y5N9_9CELL|nr:DUF1998 domain-containing protein [Cellulomonas marina]GIG29816.1 hypothetical protein Cma02nite_24160 [Cellulomonas marina]SFB08705.1 protein of unknown function [Cellulomonas marina]